MNLAFHVSATAIMPVSRTGQQRFVDSALPKFIIFVKQLLFFIEQCWWVVQRRCEQQQQQRVSAGSYHKRTLRQRVLRVNRPPAYRAISSVSHRRDTEQ